MKWLKKLAEKFGRKPEAHERDVVDISEPELELDKGPAVDWYVKRLLPRSCFTKKMTPARRRALTRAMSDLRSDQLAIVKAKGWDRGILS